MEKNQTFNAGNRRNGGPKTEAGKQRSKFNAFKHGRYAKQLLTKIGPLRDAARLREETLESLVESLGPKNPMEMNWVSTAADAKAREADNVLWEQDTIQKQIENVLEKYQEMDFERYQEQSLALELEEELSHLEKEKQTGLDWQECSAARLSFLLGAVQSIAGDEAAQTFQSLLLQEERKSFFYQKVTWDEQMLLSYLTRTTNETIEAHQAKASELSRQIEHAQRSGQKERELGRACILSGSDAEFVQSSLGSCRRQFDKAIDSLMRYRAVTFELAVRERAAMKLLQPGRLDPVQEN